MLGVLLYPSFFQKLQAEAYDQCGVPTYDQKSYFEISLLQILRNGNLAVAIFAVFVTSVALFMYNILKIFSDLTDISEAVFNCGLTMVLLIPREMNFLSKWIRFATDIVFVSFYYF